MAIDYYDNQIKAALNVYKHFKNVDGNNYPPVLLMAQTQSGKTETTIRALELIIDNNLSRNMKTSILWILPSGLELLNQTIRDIGRAPKVRERLIGDSPYHAPDIKMKALSKKKKNLLMNYKPNSGQEIKKLYEEAKNRGEYIVVVIDEAHIGIGDGQNLADYLSNQLGFFPGFDDSTSNVFTIAITATPGTYLHWDGEKQKAGGSEAFRYVYLHPGDAYNSFKYMRDVSKRLFPAFPIVQGDGSYQRFENNVIRPWLNDPNKDGYFIVRIKFEGDHLHKSLLATQVPQNNDPLYGKFKVITFSSANNNISELSDRITWEPASGERVICVIIGSYTQGKNFKDMKYVRGFWDRVSKGGSHHAFAIQSTGRNCGYYDKINLDYPIYMDFDKLDDTIDFYDMAEKASIDEENGVPNAWEDLQNKHIINDTHTKTKGKKNSTRARKVSANLLGIYDSQADLEAAHNLQSVKTLGKKRANKLYRTKNVSTQSRDLAGDIINKTIAQQSDSIPVVRNGVTYYYTVICADGVSGKKATQLKNNSWNDLCKQNPKLLIPNTKQYYVYEITKNQVAQSVKSTSVFAKIKNQVTGEEEVKKFADVQQAKAKKAGVLNQPPPVVTQPAVP